jgi:hypothetical protein
MRRHVAAVAALLLLATACSSDEVDVARADVGGGQDAEVVAAVDDGPDVEELLHDYGVLLATAAVSGGDALERTLAVTAADEHDPDCAPRWAHTLLEQAGDAPAAVEVGGEGVTIGGVDVPVDASTGRALHLGGDCDGPLPQPDRSPPEPDPEPEQAAPQMASPAAPAPQREAPPAPAPQPRPAEPEQIQPPIEPRPVEGEFSAQELARRFGDAVWRVEAEGCGAKGTGTAFAVDERTLITNWHVTVFDAAPTLVSRDGGTTLQGRVLGWTEDPDVAVIRVKETLDPQLEWESADALEEGQQLVALGYPVPETDFTVTRAHILSFQVRGGQRQAVRTDGALDYGNSGGPALTAAGKVAGVVTEMAESRGFQNVPIAYTHDHLRDTIETLERQDGVTADRAAVGGAPRW